MNKKRVIILIAISIIVLGGLIYFLNKDTKNITDINQPSSQSVLDNTLSDKLKQEKEVQYGYVYVHPKIVFAPIILKDNVSEEQAKLLAQKYADILKGKYKDIEVNVKVIDKNGNDVVGIVR